MVSFHGLLSHRPLSYLSTQGKTSLSAPAGLLVWYGSVVIEAVGMEYFKGVGSVFFVGIGAMVIGKSILPMIEQED